MSQKGGFLPSGADAVDGSNAHIAVIARRRADWPAQVRFGARNRDFRDR
jgi:hypothetical protein